MLFVNFRSIAQLADRVLKWSQQLPQDIDLIVGIPRSGMLPANLLALYRNLPFTDIDSLIAGRLGTAGGRRFRNSGRAARAPKQVLVVDDSIRTGSALREIRAKLAERELPYEISFGAVYAVPGSERKVDYYAEVLDTPRLFEWNCLHADLLSKACMDIDGVLCCDPTEDSNDDGPRYKNFLANATPLHLPSQEVGWLVTSRLEKYRAETEAWLAAHNISYRNLVMLDLPDRETRLALGSHAAFKAEVYRSTPTQLFYESSLTQSMQIAHLALKPVLCIDTMQMIYPGTVPRDRYTVQYQAPRVLMGPLWQARKVARGLRNKLRDRR